MDADDPDSATVPTSDNRKMSSSKPAFKKLNDRSLTEQAYTAIRSSILDGQIGLGERLVEYRVAQELGISRAPVREALRRLVEEQLVVERPRYGTFIRQISATDFVDIYNARLALETAAARLVARQGEPDLSVADAIVKDMFRAARKHEQERIVRLELAVHQAICDASRNSFIAASFHSLSGAIHLALALDDQNYAEIEDIATEHPPLLAALRSGDPDHAARFMHSHILGSINPVLERLGGSRADLL